MKRAILSLALLLGLTAKANALCAIQPTGLGLGIPTYGDSGPAWNACMVRLLLLSKYGSSARCGTTFLK